MCENILISKNAHPSNFYSKTKRPTSFVQETKEKINPVLPSVYRGNNTTNVQHLKKNSNPRSYEAADLNKKLITVNLPKSIFGETRKLSETAISRTSERASGYCLTSNRTFFSYIDDFDEMMMRVALYKTNTLSWICIVQAH